ncbi:MAG TPA: DUF4857 domain-containing protein [Bacteroidales bacterium]|nr:DUF4857 domain-containing protein [Bacteroidales bacterium]
MIKISRYILVLTGILVASVALPSLYWTIFEKVPRSPQIFYSCVTDDFVIADGSKRKNPEGRIFTSSEYEEALPFMFFRQLMADGEMPDTIKGVKMETPAISRASSFYRFTPRKLNSPVPTLWPMFESQSGKVNLAMPDDYFRIEQTMEFIVAKTNKIDVEKSALFTEALIKESFVLPARIIAGIPTTRKSIDEGYFVTDAEGSLFHVKMVQGQPYVVNIEMPEKLDIVYIEAVDIRSREFYCYLFTRNKGIFVVMNEVYDLQRLPIDGFNPEIHTFRLSADLFNKCITVLGENWYEAIALDDMYNVVGTQGERWESLYERPDGKTFASIFPFEIRMKDDSSAFIRFFFKPSPGFRWLIINLLTLIAGVILILRRGWPLRLNIPDLMIIGVTGIYGLLATQFFPNKFSKVKPPAKK